MQPQYYSPQSQSHLAPQQPVELPASGHHPRPTTPQNLSLVDPKELVNYLEEHRQPPIPQTWHLPPPTSSLYGTFHPCVDSDWADPLGAQEWSSLRTVVQQKSPKHAPLFYIKMEQKGGHIRDKKYCWTMSSPSSNAKSLWSYTLTRNRKTDAVLSETLTNPYGVQIHPKFEATGEYASLTFKNLDGTSYEWRSSARVSSLNGARWDTVRHALFCNNAIVADHVFWDGFVDEQEIHKTATCDGCKTKPMVGIRWKCKTCLDDHDVCNPCRQTGQSVKPSCTWRIKGALPDESMNIRMQGLDIGMAAATLQVLRDWERHLLREEKAKNPVEVAHAETLAGTQPLGMISYLKAKDLKNGKSANAELNSALHRFNHGVELGGQLQNMSAGDGGGIGGDGGGGGGGGGGDGGGGGGGC
ncbi:hypothetical protein BU16DRAFT_619138 [Lophium mytilinum]|uniref:ZZ-type domain-containing protein n=1 Tax=Lophium mytilinum TaxID=390894 RepID=A0A6A6QSQ9_9PEZI|nr:hypothetical protein BU16DRAFT_619138 [Lophium mytilinum]